jgi:signal peptidase I
MEKYRKKITLFRRLAGAFVCFVILLILMLLTSKRLLVFEIPSESMMPTLNIGDRVVVDARKPILPQYGDVVGLNNPDKVGELLCKRVVGLPGDKIMFEDGYFYLNDKAQLDEPYVMTHVIEDLPHFDLLLKDDEYFVLGDNRENSYDSLTFKRPVKQSDFVGIAKYIYWPMGRMRSLKVKRIE